MESAGTCFVQVFDVECGYEACSLELFLIKILKPTHNHPRDKNTPTGPGYEQCDYTWLKLLADQCDYKWLKSLAYFQFRLSRDQGYTALRSVT